MNKFFFLFIFIVCSFSKISHSSIISESFRPFCLSHSELQKNIIKKIDIKVEENRKWQKNLFRAYLSNHKYISKKYKKKFDSGITVFFTNGKKCTFSGKIRFSGDLRDHIKKINNNIFSSIDVSVDENILGIVRFKLILPKTRFSENEIFTNLIVDEMGFLSPKAFMIPVEINNLKHNFIFVESPLRKEFLENRNRVEGPILSADDENLFNIKNEFKKIALARIRNPSWIKNDIDKLYLSIEAITRLNLLFISQSLRSRQFGITLNGNVDNFEKDFFVNKKFLKKYYRYSLLVNGIGATNNFTVSDSRFYYNPIERDFELIYNDGYSNILYFPDSLKESLLNKNHTNYSNELITNLKNIDPNNLYSKLKNYNVEIKKKKIIKTVNLIANRIEQISKKETYADTKSLTLNDYFNHKKFLDLIINTKQYYSYFDNDNFYICINKNTCEMTNLNKAQIFKLLSQRFKLNDKKVFFLGNYKIINFNNYLNHDWKSKKIDKINILYTSDDSIKYDIDRKVLYLNHIDENSRFLISDSIIKDWKIKHNQSKKTTLYNKKNPQQENDFFQINYKNQTGCLTFYNVTFKNVSLNSYESICEDAINIINSEGYLELIEIKNSISDGLDLDFSELKIKYLHLENSENDCLDMSYGKYEIEIIKTMYCSDKGISIGENSYVKIKTLVNSNSKNSIAIKDSSEVFIDNLNSINFSESCLNVYRKKQEFEGAYLNIKKINRECFNGNNFIQENSDLKIENVS